jgi:hypothetical protein
MIDLDATTSAARARALHRAVAARMRDHEDMLHQARARVAAALHGRHLEQAEARVWLTLLARPLDEVCAALEDPEPALEVLFVHSPLVELLDTRARLEAWRAARVVVEGRGASETSGTPESVVILR